MNAARLEQIIEAVLYEGYILYPYRPTSKKNCRERFTFGRIYPEAYSQTQAGREPCLMQTQCLVHTTSAAAALRVTVRFLQPLVREVGVVPEGAECPAGSEPPFRIVPQLEVSGHRHVPWHEAVERKIEMPALKLDLLHGARQQFPFAFAPSRKVEPLCEGSRMVGVEIRRQPGVHGRVEIGAEPLEPGLSRVTVQIVNLTPVPAQATAEPDAILLRTFASSHTILEVQAGEFISLLDPAEQFKAAAAGCQNLGTWPVLVGEERAGERDTLLSSPIILYDYPQIASESAGHLFDATEIDEILTLRILTLTEEEKREMRNTDALARSLLERTETLPGESLLNMHGTLRRPDSVPTTAGAPIEFDDFFGASTRLARVAIGGNYLEPGDRVRIRPKVRADIMDLALEGKTALVEAIEEDLEHRVHLALVLESDPGKDLGMLRQPGHRFFYGIDEVEPLGQKAA